MANFAGVVELVRCNQPAPAWLEPRLKQMSDRIRAYEAGEAAAPKRIEMRARLDGFAKAVMEVRECLSDPLFVSFIGNDWSTLALNQQEIMDTLETLSNKAHGLSNKFSGKAGAIKAFPIEPNESVTAKQLCAWTVMQAMMQAGGRSVVAADNATAWAAANQLYQLSGGIPLTGKMQPDGTRGEPSGWREYINDVQHIMTENSRRGRSLQKEAYRFAAISLEALQQMGSTGLRT